MSATTGYRWTTISLTVWMARPASPPTTLPLIRMIWRSRPRSSSTRVDVSVASHRSTVERTKSAIFVSVALGERRGDVDDGPFHPSVQLGIVAERMTEGVHPLSEAAAQTRVGFGGALDETFAQPGPDEARPLDDGWVFEELVADLGDPPGPAGIGLQLLHDGDESTVDVCSQGVIGVGADLVDECLEARVQPGEHALVDDLGNPPRRLGREPGPQGGPLCGHHFRCTVEGRVHEAVMTPVLGGDLHRAAHERCHVDLVEPVGELRGQEIGDLLVVEQLGDRGRHRTGIPRRGRSVLGCRQPRRESPGDLSFLEALGEHVGGEEALTDEAPEGLSQLVLALGENGGVGNRQTERVAEQCGDCEPVGQATDHGRLGGGAYVAPYARVVTGRDARGDEDQCGHHQQSGGPALHHDDVAHAALFVDGELHGRLTLWELLSPPGWTETSWCAPVVMPRPS